jgi:hypothetical protein
MRATAMNRKGKLSQPQVAGECVDESPSGKYFVEHELVQEISSDSFIRAIRVKLVSRTEKK